MTKASARYIEKMNEISVGGEVDLLVGYCNAVGAIESSWKGSLLHAEFYAAFSKEFADYTMKVALSLPSNSLVAR